MDVKSLDLKYPARAQAIDAQEHEHVIKLSQQPRFVISC